MLKDAKRELQILRREMREAGVKKTSPFNGGMDELTYRYNARRFALETQIERLSKQSS